VAVEQSCQTFIVIGAREQAARIPQGEHEQVHRLTLLADKDLELAVVDLSLLARAGLEPHGGEL
jgi:hypothetical protein